jgi:hypothetical protein
MWLLLGVQTLAFVALGAVLWRDPAPWRPEVPDGYGYDEVECAGAAWARAADVRAVHAAADAWLARHLAEAPLAPDAAGILVGMAWESLLRLDLDRAFFLSGSSSAEEHVEVLRLRRQILLQGVTPVLGVTRAAEFEAAFFAAWREAWRGVESGRPMPEALRAAVAEADQTATSPEQP